MKKVILLITLFICTIGFANNDKYRLILNSDPSTTMMVAWNQVSGNNPTVYYDTVDHGNSDHTLYSFSKNVDRSTSYKGMENRFASLTGLTPNTNYYFIIHDSEGNSLRFWFRTAPSDLSRLSFIAGGDSRNNRGPRQNANLLVSKLKPHAVIFGGDMTSGSLDSEWQDWFDDWQLTMASNGRMFPIIPARGNHENPNNIYNLFNTTSSSDSYYAITFGADLFRIYTLNTEISVSGNQKTWLENDLLASSSVIWRSAQYHKPMRPHVSTKPEGIDRYNAWAQLFYDTGVRLVMESDSHTVKTTWPVEPSSSGGSEEGFIRNDTNGTVYVGEGCWGAPLRDANDGKNWTRNSDKFNQFKLIFVEETKIEVRTIKVDNASSVGENSDSDPFTLPANLDVWNPSEGDVVTILPAAIPNYPIIEFISGTPTNYSTGTNLTFGVDVISEGEGITKVDFYINGSLTNTDTSNPYAFTNTFADGNYLIEAIATASNGETSSTAQIIINVGNFTDTDFVAIATGNDDIEENGNDQSVYFNSSDLELINDGSRGYQKIGLRFQNINIPSGATITNAYIQFMADTDKTDPTAEFNIFIENTNNSESFENNGSANLTGRTYVGSAINWTPPSWFDQDVTSAQQTPELKSLLQSIIDINTWSQGNTISFKIEAAGASLTDPNAKRRAESFEGNYAPRLYYTYSFNAAAPSIEFDPNTQTSYTNGTNITLDIDVLDVGSGITKVEFYEDGSLVSTDTSAPYQITRSYANNSYLIEAVATDNAGKTNQTEIYLNVGSFTANYETKINNGSDDVEESEAGRVYFTSSDLEMVYDVHSEFGVANGYQKIGLRFQKINIPPGAIITSAYIQFRSDEANTESASLLIYAEDHKDAVPFEDNNAANVSSRNLIDNTVYWNPNPWTAAGIVGPDQKTNDLNDLLQGIVNRCDWSQGNSAVFIIEGTGISRTSTTAKRVGDSYEGSASNAAKLIYTYTYDASLTGAKDSEFTSSGWTNGPPSSITKVKISSDYDTSIEGSFEACSCNIENGKTLTIKSGDYININRDITVTGSLIVEHEGSVVQQDGTGIVTNNGTINVNKTTPILPANMFSILGSPMTAETRPGVFTNSNVVMDHNTLYFLPHPDVTDQDPLAENFADDNGNNWSFYTGSESIAPGIGYLVGPPTGGGAIDVTHSQGTLNNGTITYNAIYNTPGPTASDNQNASPNILSNPYASAIDAYQFINNNTSVDAVYFWEHITTPTNSYPGYRSENWDMGDISMYNLSGGMEAPNEGVNPKPSNQFIASGQGFGIKANAAGTIIFNNAMRVTDNNTGYRNNESAIDRLYIKVVNATYHLKSTTLIGFTELATNEFDSNYDAKRLATPVSIYSVLEDRELAIQGRSVFDADQEIPLGFRTMVEEEQSYSISISSIEGDLITNTTIYLQDNLLNTVTNLSETDYTFTSNMSNQKDRFVILFSEEVLDNSTSNVEAIIIYPNPTNNILNIISPLEAITSIEVFDVRGRKINSKLISTPDNYQLDFTALNNAMYFVKINTNTGSVTKRILKK